MIAVIPVAGSGSRMYPITRAIPKALLPVVDMPVIHYLLWEAKMAGIDEIVLVVNPEHHAPIERYVMSEWFRAFDRIDICVQVSPTGLGEAVLTAENCLKDEPFAVLLGDDIIHNRHSTIGLMMDVRRSFGGVVLGVKPVPVSERCKYGMIKGTQMKWGLLDVKDLIEKPAQDEETSEFAIMGRYILDPNIMPYLKNQTAGINGEIQLTDAIKRYAQDNQQVWAFEIEGVRYDVGSKLGYITACHDYALRSEFRDDYTKHIVGRGLL